MNRFLEWFLPILALSIGVMILTVFFHLLAAVKRRKNADYDLDQVRFDSESLAVESITRVDRILRTMDACREDAVRSEIHKGTVR